MSGHIVEERGGAVVHGVVPLSCLIDLPYITHPQAAKQAANSTSTKENLERVFHPEYNLIIRSPGN
jgi:hypothetical protein